MAGKVTKNVMYTPMRVVRLWPDYRMFRMWYGTVRADKRDDSILLGVIAEFERDGMAFASALDYCPELLVDKGILTRRRPTDREWKDVEFGWGLAKEMGRLDVGQSVAVKERAAIAVEAIEGTDRCIERAGALCRAGGWTLVKVAKPQQDMRFDVPTVGVSTVGEPPQVRGEGPGDRGEEDDRHRPARRGRPRRPLRPGDRRDRPGRGRRPGLTGPVSRRSGSIDRQGSMGRGRPAVRSA